MQPLDLLRNLAIMAAADGSVSEDERTLLEERRQLWGISDEQFAAVLADVDAGLGELTIPAKAHQRHDYLFDLIEMIGADGRIDAAERRLLESAAARMGIEPAELDELVQEFTDDDDLTIDG